MVGTFQDRVVFITGASSGIGGALAREFARRGAPVALGARRLDRLEALAEELRGAGGRALALACDVTREGDLERALARARDTLGPIHVLVANAGFGVVGAVASLTLDDYRRQFETNVFGVLRTIQAGLADLASTRGHLVLLGSVSGHVALAGSSPYAMSKFAVRALAQSLDFELRPRGIAVTLISPGFVNTEIHEVDNLGVRHPGVRHRAPRWVRMDAARAARLIVAAVARRRREVVLTGLGQVTVFIHRHAPWLFTWAVRTFGVKTRTDPRTSIPGRS
jgi:short-subunit dehydrogenase